MPEEKTWSWMDKDAWGAGPWSDEPDKVQWNAPNGMVCMARRGPLGCWCGYVGVGPGHPMHGADYDSVGVDVHGGLTFAAGCDGDEEQGICHVPEPGGSDEMWWFGFDMGHAFDYIPKMAVSLVEADAYDSVDDYRDKHSRYPLNETYRDLAYARGECENLATQLASKRLRKPWLRRTKALVRRLVVQESSV